MFQKQCWKSSACAFLVQIVLVVLIGSRWELLIYPVNAFNGYAENFRKSWRPADRSNLFSVDKLGNVHGDDAFDQDHDDISEIAYTSLQRLFVGPMGDFGDISISDSKLGAPISILQPNARVKLSREQSHYLIKVLRIFSKGGGEQKRGLIRCFDGLNGEWLCKVIQPDVGTSSPTIKNNRQRKVNKKSSVVKAGLLLEVQCIQQLRIQSDNVKKPYLFFAPIKKQRAKALIEKCTECGAGLFFPVLTDNTDPSAAISCIGTPQSLETEAVDSIMFQQVSDAKNHIDGIQKLSMIACEAAEQSEQLSVPAFMTYIKDDGGDQHMTRKGSTSVTHLFEGWLCSRASFSSERILLICRERRDDVLHVYPALTAMKIATQSNPGVRFAFLVGPEGGWSRQEEIMFDNYCAKYPDFFMGISLGSNILRAETAGMLAIGSFSLFSCSDRL